MSKRIHTIYVYPKWCSYLINVLLGVQLTMYESQRLEESGIQLLELQNFYKDREQTVLMWCTIIILVKEIP